MVTRVTLFLSDPVVYYDDESVVNLLIQGSGKPCPSDCFTHARIGDVRLPRRALEADTIIATCGLENFERASGSKQHTHKFGGSHDGLATVGDFDKFAESFENNYPEVCDVHSLWMIDCRKLDGTDGDKVLEMHVGRNSSHDHEIYFGIQGLPRAARSSIRGNITILLSPKRPDHDLRERTPQFCCERRVVVVTADTYTLFH